MFMLFALPNVAVRVSCKLGRA